MAPTPKGVPPVVTRAMRAVTRALSRAVPLATTTYAVPTPVLVSTPVALAVTIVTSREMKMTGADGSTFPSRSRATAASCRVWDPVRRTVSGWTTMVAAPDTFTTTVADALPLATRMKVVPDATAVTRPEALTVATVVSFEWNVTAAARTLSLASYTVAWSCCVPPMARDVNTGVTSTRLGTRDPDSVVDLEQATRPRSAARAPARSCRTIRKPGRRVAADRVLRGCTTRNPRQAQRIWYLLYYMTYLVLFHGVCRGRLTGARSEPGDGPNLATRREGGVMARIRHGRRGLRAPASRCPSASPRARGTAPRSGPGWRGGVRAAPRAGRPAAPR